MNPIQWNFYSVVLIVQYLKIICVSDSNQHPIHLPLNPDEL